MDFYIASLADHPRFIPILAEWFHAKWGELGESLSVERQIARLERESNRNSIPFTLVALVDGQPVGTGCVRRNGMATRPQLNPWAEYGLVLSSCRRRGIGSALIRKRCEIVQSLGYQRLYLYSPAAGRFYLKRGAQLLERTTYAGEAVDLLCFDLKTLPGQPVA